MCCPFEFSSEVSEELERLLQYNFLSQQLARVNGFTPDGQTYAVMLPSQCLILFRVHSHQYHVHYPCSCKGPKDILST